MVTVVLNAPFEFAGTSANTVAASKIIDTDAFAENPEPVTVTLVPGGPLVGDSVILRAA